jgi:hypothetical protein
MQLMRKSLNIIAAVALVALFSLGGEEGSGCEVSFVNPEPTGDAPFDTTGLYSGDWSYDDEQLADLKTLVVCPATLTLLQDVNLEAPDNHDVTGDLTLDFGCMLGLDPGSLGLPTVLPVAGELEPDEDLELSYSQCDSGLCIEASMDGEGEDTDGDGLMDRYVGEWEVEAYISVITLADLSGTFDFIVEK